MNQITGHLRGNRNAFKAGKFNNPLLTAKGEERAEVRLESLDTLWINTGTLCNITCKNCYIDSSPKNDDLVYFPLAELVKLLDEIAIMKTGTREIGFTGGEPFMNPQMPKMMRLALERGFEVLVLTNAMQPMQRKKTRAELIALKDEFGDRLTLRISLDHYTRQLHERERGAGSWDITVEGIDWLAGNGFSIAIAGRTCWGEDELSERVGYEKLMQEKHWPIDCSNPAQLSLFPEMDLQVEVPEITTACWEILGKHPSDVMCATSRMVVLRKGRERPAILPCTLIAYDEKFEMGDCLADAMKKDGGNFSRGAVKLNHPHCSKFCVLGGGSCSV